MDITDDNFEECVAEFEVLERRLKADFGLVLEDQVKYKLLEAALDSYFKHEAAEYVDRKRQLDIVYQELAERGQVIENKRRRSLVASGRQLQLVQSSTPSTPPARVSDVVFQNAMTAELLNLRQEMNAKLGVLPTQMPPLVSITGFSLNFLQRTIQSPTNEGKHAGETIRRKR